MAAPILDTTLPRTPADEWASMTADALSQRKQAEQEGNKHPADYKGSAATTPGIDIPGSYPRSTDKNAPSASETLPASVEQMKGLASNVADTALAYLPSRQDTVGMLEKAKGYLPQAVQEYFPVASSQATHSGIHPTSLPSQEVHGDTSGKSDGVGSLPGDITEAAVAKLPDERTEEEKQPLRSQHPVVTTTNTLKDPPTSLHEPSHAVTAKDKRIIDSPIVTDGGSPVSSLPPNPIREVTLPASGLPSHAVTAKDDKIVDSPAFNGSGSRFSTLPDAPAQEAALPMSNPHKTETANTHPPTLPTNFGYSVNNQAPPLTRQSPPTNDGHDRGTKGIQDSASDDQPSSPTAHSSFSTESSEKKRPSLMNRIKGEAKVISGKVTHNEEKVCEGRKLKGQT